MPIEISGGDAPGGARSQRTENLLRKRSKRDARVQAEKLLQRPGADDDTVDARPQDDTRIQRVWTAVMSALSELGSLVPNPDLERIHGDLAKVRAGGKLEAPTKRSSGQMSRINQAEMMAQVARNVLGSQPPNPDVAPQTEVFESF